MNSLGAIISVSFFAATVSLSPFLSFPFSQSRLRFQTRFSHRLVILTYHPVAEQYFCDLVLHKEQLDGIFSNYKGKV
jgi:hypothetical protein